MDNIRINESYFSADFILKWAELREKQRNNKEMQKTSWLFIPKNLF